MQSPHAPTPRQRLESRYGEPASETDLPWSAVVDHLLDHRSVRKFLPDPVSDEHLQTLIAAAQSAPSSSNLFAWSVVAVSDRALRARLGELVGNQPHVREAPLQLVWIADLSILERLSQAKQFPVQGLDYLELFLIAAMDAAFAAQNASVAAQSLGLGTVYIGGMRNRIEEVAAALGLPPRAAPLFGMCVGTPDPLTPTQVRPRPPQSVVLHRERYDTTQAMEGLHRYEAAMKTFYASQAMNADSWMMRALRRVATPEALTGRHILRDALQRLGFGLR